MSLKVERSSFHGQVLMMPTGGGSRDSGDQASLVLKAIRDRCSSSSVRKDRSIGGRHDIEPQTAQRNAKGRHRPDGNNTEENRMHLLTRRKDQGQKSALLFFLEASDKTCEEMKGFIRKATQYSPRGVQGVIVPAALRIVRQAVAGD